MTGRLVMAVVVAATIPVFSTQASAAPMRTVRDLTAAPQTADPDLRPLFVSPDGSVLLFQTGEPLVPSDTNGAVDVYLRTSAGALHRIAPPISATFVGGSTFDGSKIWVNAEAPLSPSDHNGALDVYELHKDGSARLISSALTGIRSTFVGASRDGAHVVFTHASPARTAIFDRHADGTLKELADGSFPTWPYGVSHDGSRVVFTTNAALVSADQDTTVDVYAQPTAGGPPALMTSGDLGPMFTTVRMDDDVSRVWYDTANQDDPADTDAAVDVYTDDLGHEPRLVTPGTDQDARLSFISRDGAHVWFGTVSKLVPEDTDGLADWYLATPNGPRLVTPGGSADGTIDRLSEDGRAILTSDLQLTADDRDGVSDLYAWSVDGGYRLLTPGTADAISVAPAGLFAGDHRPLVLDVSGALAPLGDPGAAPTPVLVTATGLELLTPPDVIPHPLDNAYAATPDGSRVYIAATASFFSNDAVGMDLIESTWGAPVVLRRPQVAGALAIDRRVSCPGATFDGLGVGAPITRWLRNGKQIATGPSHVIQSADGGTALACTVTAANVGGSGTAAASSVEVPPLPRPDSELGLPVVGLSLACPSLVGAHRTSYRWHRSGRSADRGSRRTIRLGRSDAGHNIACIETARSVHATTTVRFALRIPAHCTVPGLRGLTRAAARREAGLHGCRARVVVVRGGHVRKGLVVGANLLVGTVRANGTTLIVRVRRP